MCEKIQEKTSRVSFRNLPSHPRFWRFLKASEDDSLKLGRWSSTETTWLDYCYLFFFGLDAIDCRDPAGCSSGFIAARMPTECFLQISFCIFRSVHHR